MQRATARVQEVSSFPLLLFTKYDSYVCACRILSELKTLSSLLATSHTLLDRLTNETQDLRVWIDDMKAVLELGEKGATSQHQVKMQVRNSEFIAM